MRLASLAAALAFCSGAAAQDAARGRELYETHCGGCHYERVHQRERSRAQLKSLTALRLEVARWAAQVKRPFSAAELDDLAEYLNRSHYKFEK
jgi:mono/diheme cytochrome c family protein